MSLLLQASSISAGRLLKDHGLRAYTFSKVKWWKCHLFPCWGFPSDLESIAQKLRQWLRQNSGRGEFHIPVLNPVFSLLKLFSGSVHFKPKCSQYAGGIEGLGRGGRVEPLWVSRMFQNLQSGLLSGRCSDLIRVSVAHAAEPSAAFGWDSPFRTTRPGPALLSWYMMCLFPSQHVASSGRSWDIWESLCWSLWKTTGKM